MRTIWIARFNVPGSLAEFKGHGGYNDQDGGWDLPKFWDFGAILVGLLFVIAVIGIEKNYSNRQNFFDSSI